MRSIGIYEGEEYPPEILLGYASHCFAVRLRKTALQFCFAQDDTGGGARATMDGWIAMIPPSTVIMRTTVVVCLYRLEF